MPSEPGACGDSARNATGRGSARRVATPLISRDAPAEVELARELRRRRELAELVEHERDVERPVVAQELERSAAGGVEAELVAQRRALRVVARCVRDRDREVAGLGGRGRPLLERRGGAGLAARAAVRPNRDRCR
jgi:hypothetical protein